MQSGGLTGGLKSWVVKGFKLQLMEAKGLESSELVREVKRAVRS
jgi:hypothetical protein